MGGTAADYVLGWWVGGRLQAMKHFCLSLLPKAAAKLFVSTHFSTPGAPLYHFCAGFGTECVCIWGGWGSISVYPSR